MNRVPGRLKPATTTAAFRLKPEAHRSWRKTGGGGNFELNRSIPCSALGHGSRESCPLSRVEGATCAPDYGAETTTERSEVLVEAAGVEREAARFSYLLMARDFWVNSLRRRRLTPFSVSTDVDSDPLKSTPLVEK